MNKFLGIFPKPAPIRPESRVYDLKERLDWGEPALTIIDVRPRHIFNESRVTGAISMPVDCLVERATLALEYDRDVYVYADRDEEAAIAAQALKEAGFKHISVLRGGVAAWKAAGFPIESTLPAVA